LRYYRKRVRVRVAHCVEYYVLVLALSLNCFSTTLHAQSRHLVTFDDLISANLQHVAYPMDISPDGHTLAYSVEPVDDDSLGTLWLIDVPNRAPRPIGTGMMPRWSPDGRHLAYYSARSGTLQLWILDRLTSSARQITSLPGGIRPNPTVYFGGWIVDPLRFSWSPDGTKIAFTSQVQAARQVLGSTGVDSGAQSVANMSVASEAPDADESRPLVLTTKTPNAWTFTRLFRSASTVGSEYANGRIEAAGGADSSARLPPLLTNQVFVVDVATKALQQLTHDDGGYFEPDWSPDGMHIVVASTEGQPVSLNLERSNLYLIYVPTGHKAAITAGSGIKVLPSWSPRGSQIAFLGKRRFGVSGISLVSLSDTATKEIGHLDRDVSHFAWSRDGKSIVLSYQDGPANPVARLELEHDVLHKLTRPDAFCEPFAMSRSGTLAWAQADGSSSDVLYIGDGQGRDQHLLRDLNPQLRQWALGKQEIVTSTNSRGDTVEGILIKPVGFEPGVAYPLIVDPYPGVINSLKLQPMQGNQAFASRGYAVFFPNERTAHTWENPFKGTGYGEAARGVNGADLMMDDLTAGIDNLIERGIVDPSRMCLYGFSNGGGATNLIVTRTNRFACAVSASGVQNDWALTFYLGAEDEPNLLNDILPWSDPAAYTGLSPIYHLDKVKTPMLLAVGDDERGVLLLANIELYKGLRYLRRDVTLLRYPGQGHGFTGAALRDYWQRANAFFDAYLKPEPPSLNTMP
jgi:dipeptidyl aminopeptidase/acylaminoacyl peptidase